MSDRKVFLKMRDRVLKASKITPAVNIKLGNMGSWGELFGNCDWEIPELGITIKGTCGGHCKGCFNPEEPRKSPCYVVKSYMKYTNRNEDGSVGDIRTNECSVKLGHAYRTIAMTMFRKELLCSLDYQLTKKHDTFKVIRINESGELTCYEDFELWCELARRHTETMFYLYTKNYLVIRKAIDNDIIPGNLFVNISIWHQYGINAYLEMEKHPQIRAFVLVDDEWTVHKYAKKGINIQCMCPAYDSNGKMNHEVTCQKCKICYCNKAKVCGCFDH